VDEFLKGKLNLTIKKTPAYIWAKKVKIKNKQED
jgi:hypothetical protein